jgi:hypothetical protein
MDFDDVYVYIVQRECMMVLYQRETFLVNCQ